MFKNIFAKKKGNNLEKVEKKWTFFTLKDGDKQFITRFRSSLWKIANDNVYPYLVGLAMPISDRTNNLPSGKENKMFLLIEDKISTALETGSNTIHAGTIMGDGMKEFVFYTDNPKKVKNIMEKISDDIKGYTIQMHVEKDKEWMFFKTHCPQGNN